MKIVIITGSSGLIGSESVRFFGSHCDRVVGIDNNMRKYFFGEGADTTWNRRLLQDEYSNFLPLSADIRDWEALERIFGEYSADISLIIHTAAQPSHDWAAKEPLTDFTVNSIGTLNLLELTRKYCPRASFIFTSTNKVYGDTPNALPLIELEKRWEVDPSHSYYEFGIDEHMTVDQSKHSLFGVSKLAADIMVQEYGRYFGMNTVVFRGGCLTGPNHSGAQLHGFLSYLVKCCITGLPYTIFGYKGKQVRDNIHSHDLVNMFWHYSRRPSQGKVYNAGGGRFANCSMLEAIELAEKICGKKMHVTYSDQNRSGDHIWWISDVRKFEQDYPEWHHTYDLVKTLQEMYDSMSKRLEDEGH